ncbi:hypothetical protein NEOLEDRAFT_1052949 [Neolentinus lepideus HHB14362 ss-1]|uniref:SNF2 family DNA-dependent ATPase domain-containing protein n=1 Tax=Neolentinus lepideus HHB14362 ss-1 TaxID=1314782 RepID=A0A165W667_9AGAM|nr:hypothetical protein NEOLEDRAFT_1052949 [Neolentinus lepideus HHB14362 ss-1]
MPWKSGITNSAILPPLQGPQGPYRPAFAGPGPLPPMNVSFPDARASGSQTPHSTTHSPPLNVPSIGSSSRQVIDLTTSPSPPPQIAPTFQANMGGLPDSLPPKTPVCIGQLGVTALVLYPIPYLRPVNTNGMGGEDWVPVRLQYEHCPDKGGSQETIHIKTPVIRTPMGEIVTGENFGVVEQKVATALGPMLGKGLIKLDAKVRRGMPNVPILPLHMLVSTPKGNIPVVGNYFHRNGLLLDHPTYPFDRQSLGNFPYYNPHNPPPGGFRNMFANQRLGYAGPGGSSGSRWSAPAVPGKSVEVQRSQIDELFKSLKSGEEVAETEPPFEVATKLYPHQKKALTFLLEREQERPCPDGKSSLWQERTSPISGHKSWFHIVTQKEVFEKPFESKGAILADDMGLGKTITCVSLIASTLDSARAFAVTCLVSPKPPPIQPGSSDLSASHFAGSVWGMPECPSEPLSSKGKGRAAKEQDKAEQEYVRACRIKIKSRATLIICPLSTVQNWEEQFREHWKGEVSVIGGAGSVCAVTAALQSQSLSSVASESLLDLHKPAGRVREGRSLRVYVYHGNSRRPDPAFLADFDAVITTYTTLASEFSKQTKSVTMPDEEDEESSDGIAEVDEMGNAIVKFAKAKKNAMKRKKPCSNSNGVEATSPLQSVYWFRVVLDEAHTIKETSTVGCRASCDLMADRRLCLTGTPVQNKLDDVFALIKFLRVAPFDDKAVWTEYIGSPVKFGQPLGVARLQTIMKCITLRRTKESKTQDGKRILSLPPRRDELRFLKFDEQEQAIYDRFFSESKAEFNELSNKNEVMKNYVGILQKILRLRQICDHYELVQTKNADQSQGPGAGYDNIMAAICKEGIDASKATAVFAILRESGTTQCVECGGELSIGAESLQSEGLDTDAGPSKRGRKLKTASRASTRPSSPSGPRPILTRCQHLFCFGCYQNAVCPGWPNVELDVVRSCSTCQYALGPLDAIEVSPYCAPPETMCSKKKPMKRQKKPRDVLLENFRPSTKVKALLSDLMQFSRANPHSANYDSASMEIQMVDNQGNQLDDGIIKTIVFSQWTSMLDKVEDALEAAGIRYERLDGTMKRDDRTRAMEILKHDPGCEVLLVSLKAGGVGLNLTAAQRVYLMDPYWNPAVENQAVDRIHRLGQTRPVTTVKLIIENTIEARLLEVQRKKTELANMTLGQNFSKAEMLQRRMEELNQLFKT